MVTSDEIAQVPLFAALTAADRERLSRACADIRLSAGEYAVHEGEDRALFTVLEGRIEVVKLVDGIERVLGERLPGTIFGEVPITLGTAFPSGFRAAEPSRVMQVEAARVLHARRGGARRRAQGRRARARAHRGAPGRRRRGTEAPRIARRAALGCSVLRSAPLPRSQPDHVRVDHAGRRQTPSRRWGGELPPRATVPRSAPGRHDAPAAAAAGRCRSARAADARLRGGVRHDHRRRRPGRPRRRRLRGVGGPAHDRDRARGARRPGRLVLADRELPRLPAGVSGDELSKRALQQARRLGAEILVTRSITGLDPGDAHAPSRRRRRAARRARSSSPPA